MWTPKGFRRCVGHRWYDVETATLIAHGYYWDGKNYQRDGRKLFLYRTPGGAYFVVSVSVREGERDYLEPVSIEDAVTLYEGWFSERDRVLNFREAFPNLAAAEE